MGDALIRQLLSFCLLRNTVEENFNTDLEFIQVVQDYEAVRKKWLQAETELKKQKELLVKADVARAALEVKLKHARNQVDVEIKKRYKAEADYQYMERQMQLICEILMHDSKSSACLNDEQRTMLATFNHRGGANVPQQKAKRLSVIDESSFLFHSDVSYDRSDDDLDLDTTVIKPLKSRAREKRRSSMGPTVGPVMQKRGRISGRSGDLISSKPVERETETVVKASVTTPEGGGPIHMVIDITQDSSDKLAKASRVEQIPSLIDQTSVWVQSVDVPTENETVEEVEQIGVDAKVELALPAAVETVKHVFQTKTVIRPETCTPCGKRIRFGKAAVKCRDCRLVAHPECEHLCSQQCTPNAPKSAPKPPEHSLENFVPATKPQIPPIMVQCVNEIEKRGLVERGIYRVPGGERMVKELREKYIMGKGPLVLNKVDEIHVVCGLLKDFLRKLKEPLVTFRLHRTFIEASEIVDDDDSTAAVLKAIGQLPAPNRDTLAFLMLHLQKVMQSPLCQMDLNNLARVFGPTIVGHSMSEPSPLTIMKDTNSQPKVVARMLSLPGDYWKRLIMLESDRVISCVIDANINTESSSTDRDCLFKPLTSPEMSKLHKTPATGSVRGKFRNLGTAFTSTGKTKADITKKKFFTSPS